MTIEYETVYIGDDQYDVAFEYTKADPSVGVRPCYDVLIIIHDGQLMEMDRILEGQVIDALEELRRLKILEAEGYRNLPEEDWRH